MGYQMYYGTQYPQQGYGMGYPSAGYPNYGYPGYPGYPPQQQQQPASGGGADANAILGAVIQPLMGLVQSLLLGGTGSEQPYPVPTEDPTQSSGGTDSGVSESTLGPDSETSDYLDVLNDKSNSKDLKALEKKYGKGVSDGKLTADEVHNILRAIEKGKKGTEDVSEDLKTALTWLDQDETGQTVMLNLSNEFDKEGNAAVDIRKGFDESNIKDVDALEEDVAPADGEEVVQYMLDNHDFIKEVAGDGEITQDEIDTALKSDQYDAEQKAQLRFLRAHFDDIHDAIHGSGNPGQININNDPSEGGSLKSWFEKDGVASKLQNID